MFGERKQLDVGVAHLLHILDQRLCQLIVGVKAFAVCFVLDPPGTGVQLIDVHGTVIVFLPLRHISLVLPAVSLQKADHCFRLVDCFCPWSVLTSLPKAKGSARSMSCPSAVVIWYLYI